jgi:hypothetical protein
MSKENRIFVQCDCSDPRHLLEIEVDEGLVHPEMRFWYKLNWRLPLAKRIVSAARYVLHLESWTGANWLDFDEFAVSDDGTVTKIRDACNRFLSAHERRSSKAEVCDRLQNVIRTMRDKDVLADEWLELLAKRLDRSAEDIRKHGLTADDFPSDETISLTFEDGSSLCFANALLLDKGRDTALFTEHCGYHVFPSESITSVNWKPPSESAHKEEK